LTSLRRLLPLAAAAGRCAPKPRAHAACEATGGASVRTLALTFVLTLALALVLTDRAAATGR
jgi:hypothetical protein